MIKIQKDKFIEHMKNIMKLLDMERAIEEVGRGAYGTRFEMELVFPTLVEDVIELLRDATNDEDESIEYFLCEIDCGRKWKPGMITAADGTDIPMGTLDDLWNLLVSDEKRRDEEKWVNAWRETGQKID